MTPLLWLFIKVLCVCKARNNGRLKGKRTHYIKITPKQIRYIYTHYHAYPGVKKPPQYVLKHYSRNVLLTVTNYVWYVSIDDWESFTKDFTKVIKPLLYSCYLRIIFCINAVHVHLVVERLRALNKRHETILKSCVERIEKRHNSSAIFTFSFTYTTWIMGSKRLTKDCFSPPNMSKNQYNLKIQTAAVKKMMLWIKIKNKQEKTRYVTHNTRGLFKKDKRMVIFSSWSYMHLKA